MRRNATPETVLAAARQLWPDAQLVEFRGSPGAHASGWRVVVPMQVPGFTDTVADAQTLEQLLAKIEAESDRCR